MGRPVFARGRRANAHDAGLGGWSLQGTGQLMLMMLGIAEMGSRPLHRAGQLRLMMLGRAAGLCNGRPDPGFGAWCLPRAHAPILMLPAPAACLCTGQAS